MEISSLRSKVMAVKGQVSVRNKIVIDNTKLAQVNMSIYLGCKDSYEE
jgi:hypothetical protein